jgi:hypothetical protein
MTPGQGANAKKAGFGPLFRIRSCRIAGWSCCQFIRGQRRTGIVEGRDLCIEPFSIGDCPKAVHADLVDERYSQPK